jgi:hypothetical protein
MAQDEDEQFRLGTHIFRSLLHSRNLTPLDAWQRIENDPAKTILILMGKPQWPVPGGLRHFIEQGGAVLLATDHPLNDQARGINRQLIELCGFGMLNNHVGAWEPDHARDWRFVIPVDRQVNPRFFYRGRQANLRGCIIVEAQRNARPALFWDVLHDRQLDVVANHSNCLLPTQGGLPPGVQIQARFPRGCWYDFGYFLQRGTPPPPFAVSRELGHGRLLVLADHKVFINEMMFPEDNNNLTFAFNVVEWLREGRRTRVLFVEDGAIQYEFNLPLDQVVEPLKQIQPGLAKLGNDTIKQVQERHARENHLNTALVHGVSNLSTPTVFPHPEPANFWFLLVLVCTVVVGCYGVARLRQATNHLDTRVPLLASAVGQHRPVGSALTMRQRAALSEDDLRDFARALARDWFADVPGSPGGPGEDMPDIAVRTRWWQGWTLRRQVQDLWHLAHGDYVPRLTAGAFRSLLRQIDQLSEALDRGDIRLTWETH